MFGFLKAKKCDQTAAQNHRRRLHYCGICKTTGSLYGARSRFLLNHDTVFLAELLTAVTPDGENFAAWDASLQSYNCLALPKNSAEVSPALKFAATANVVLAQFKIRDQIIDSGSFKWKTANRVFSESFRQAAQNLRDAGLAPETISAALAEQEKRENAVSANETNPFTVLDFLAEPTATVTALFFAKGAKAVQRPDLAEKFKKFGNEFGKLIYLLDALEDFEKDAKCGEFNAIRQAFGVSEKTLPSAVRRCVIGELNSIQTNILLQINDFPILDELKKVFVGRFETNLARKIQTKLPVLPTVKSCVVQKPAKSLADKFNAAKLTAKRLTVQGFSAKNWRDNPQIPLVFAFVTVFAFVAPNYAKHAKSWQECASLSLNLVFLGGIFTSAFASFGSFAKSAQSVLSVNQPEKLSEMSDRSNKARKRENWRDSCCRNCDCHCCDDCCRCCDDCNCCVCDCN